MVFVAKKSDFKRVLYYRDEQGALKNNNGVSLWVLLVCYNEIMTQFGKCLISFISINYVCTIYCAAFTPISQGWLNLTRREGWISFRPSLFFFVFFLKKLKLEWTRTGPVQLLMLCGWIKECEVVFFGETTRWHPCYTKPRKARRRMAVFALRCSCLTCC